LDELEHHRESVAVSIEASVKDRFQHDIRLLEDQLQDKNRVCVWLLLVVCLFWATVACHYAEFWIHFMAHFGRVYAFVI